MEQSYQLPFIDKVRYELEVEKKRGHFSLNYLPYNPVGSLSDLDIHHSKYNLPEVAHFWDSHLKVRKDGAYGGVNSHTNPFSRHNKRPIHPGNNGRGKGQRRSYSGGFSNILMELKIGGERLKFSRIGKSYDEIFIEEDEFEKLLALPKSISYQNINTYLKKFKSSSDHSRSTTPKQPIKQVNRKLVISQRFRPMLLLCRRIANMKGNSTPTNCTQEKCVSKIYTVYLLLNGIYNIGVKDLKSKFPLSKDKLKEIFKDLHTVHRHYSHHNIHSSSNHYHHHYTSKPNTQQKIHINPLLIEQTEHVLSSQYHTKTFIHLPNVLSCLT
ncbi:hypothetical protein LOD99_13500 [Oopsacas minuta]|uniref:Uncharacterized protein n=1 Tax=Oopsacas minuta TaxID=111878 RepID=A0AAV7KJS4_9METZ|nr:hypothetical protein LOD99_13500 [Oopsacas minuta]